MANLPNPSRPRVGRTSAPQYRAGFGAVVNAPDDAPRNPRPCRSRGVARPLPARFRLGLAQVCHRPSRPNHDQTSGEVFMSRRIVAAALLIAVTGPAAAVELNPKAIAIRQADELKWRDPTGAAPTNQVVLFGDPTKPGFYMVMNRFKPGTFSKPHFHPNDRFITVIKGTWYVGTGKQVGQGRDHPGEGRRRGHALRQGGALRRRQGRRGGRADHRRGSGHQHAGRRGEVGVIGAAAAPQGARPGPDRRLEQDRLLPDRSGRALTDRASFGGWRAAGRNSRLSRRRRPAPARVRCHPARAGNPPRSAADRANATTLALARKSFWKSLA